MYLCVFDQNSVPPPLNETACYLRVQFLKKGLDLFDEIKFVHLKRFLKLHLKCTAIACVHTDLTDRNVLFSSTVEEQRNGVEKGT